jgi:hypothetical protein
MKFFSMLFGKKKRELGVEDKRQIQDPPLEEGHEPQPPASEKTYWFFLSYFWDPIDISKDKHIVNWSKTLGRSYKNVIDEFFSKGLIMEAGVKEKLTGMLRVQDLKQLLKEHGLVSSGNKEELLKRFVEALPEEAKKIADTMVGDFLMCTVDGRKTVASRITRKANREDSIEQEIRLLLRRGNIDQAAEVVINQRQSFHYAPRDDNWIIKDIKMVMDIKEVPGLTPEEVEEARINWAIERLWRGDSRGMFYSQIPSFQKYARFVSVIIQKKESQETLQGYRENECITGVEIMCNDDSCRKCKAAAGEYLLKEAPLLPIDGCTNEDGCRCSYNSVVGFD